MGAINYRDSSDLSSDVGRRITHSTDDHRESAYLFQRLSVLIQRYNAVAVLKHLCSHSLRGEDVFVLSFSFSF